MPLTRPARAPRHRSRASRVARGLCSGGAVVMVAAGVLMLAYPFATNVSAQRLQRRLAVELTSPGTREAYAAGRIEEGDGLTRLAIPAIGVDVVVVEGTSDSALRAGAGHYPNTPLPGDEGNVAIAGHRTTFGKPFARLDELDPGDDITLDTPLGRHTYRVARVPYVVAATDWAPIAQSAGTTLTLTTCHPKGSSRQRLVVKADLVGGDPPRSPA